jgi:hypothetical protein
MTTEPEVTLPDALAWLKTHTGAYPAKIIGFIESKISTENDVSFCALNKCADTAYGAWESGFVDIGEKEALDIEMMIRNHAFDNYHKDGYVNSGKVANPPLDELRNWERLRINKVGDSQQNQDIEMVACPYCKKEYPDFTADSEFIGWHGVCAGCALNGVEL